MTSSHVEIDFVSNLFACRSDYAYGNETKAKIPGGSTLIFDVELLGFGPPKKESWEYTEEEKLQEASKLKEEGTVAFKAGDFKEV